MISKKYAQPLFMIFMSFGMSVIMSGVVSSCKHWYFMMVMLIDGFILGCLHFL